LPVSSRPRISVLILNYNGREHLEACLPTVVAQTYPRDRFQIEVIDNGSTDGSLDFVRATYPQVRVHALERNLGFAEPYDTVARASDSDWVVFLNNDTRVDPNWLSALVDAAGQHGADCVASKILDWDGRRIDFVGGLTTFIGHSWQRDNGEPAAREYLDVPLLFACGGSMLIRRDAYVDAGGFDRDFFAYFEDVDLGWRMNVLGYRTMLAPKAVTYHRLHGTAGKIAFAQRLRLYERNALAMIYKNYEAETLRRVLPAAIALSLARGLVHSGVDPRTFALGSTPPPTVELSARSAVHLLALEDFYRSLPALSEKRAAIQSRRKVSDAELFTLFGEPFRLHEQGSYGEIARTLIRDLGIDEIFASEATPHRTTLLPSDDAVLETRTTQPFGPGRRGSLVQDDAKTLPKVSVIVLTVLGSTHLPDCLSSLRAQTYPAALREILVVDNASAEDPTEVVRQYYPDARVIRNPANVGFAVGNNIGAKAATGEYVVFLNDDTRVHPEWLRELVGTAVRRGAVSVGSRMLSWDGSLIDFAGASVNFEGKGFQVDIGQPEAGRYTEERPLLFACGGAMLVRRDVFLETGGWDEAAFAYYEDVELGWRFWLLGHEVWFSPRSIVYHKHHGTWGRWPSPPRLRLYERNSLRILYTHLERDTLVRVLPAALLLATDLALLSTDFSRAARDADEVARDEAHGRNQHARGWRALKTSLKAALRERGVNRQSSVAANLRRVGPRGLLAIASFVLRGGPASVPQVSRRAALQIERGAASFVLDDRTETIPTSAAAALSGVYDFIRELPVLTERRRALQSARRRTDRDILSRFNSHWTHAAVARYQVEHEDVHWRLVEEFGIEEIAKET
jgi:GT2 family glycosyltransferase